MILSAIMRQWPVTRRSQLPNYVKTDDIQFWGISLNMKYHF